jgi:hypothetical protein
MKPKVSWPYSQEPATGFYYEPDESSPHSRTLYMRYFNIIFPEKIIPDSVQCNILVWLPLKTSVLIPQ